MRVFLLAIVAGALTLTAALVDRPPVAVLATTAVAFTTYGAWLVGHEQGWRARCDAIDAQRTKET